MEKSSGCIIFNNNKVLVVKQINGDYGFPKGHIEDNETLEECAIRETFEEVGLRVKVDPNLKFSISYFVHNNVPKKATYFVSFLIDTDNIVIQEEEIEEAMWVNIDDVYNILSFDNLKKLWTMAYNKYMEVYNGKINI